jgi:large subunit ribosomal protein L15
MRLHELHPAKESTRPRRRIGRGNASGTGTTAGKGTKGQKARSGGIKSSYTGRSSRMQRFGKLPGFNNKWRTEFATVKLADLERFDADSVVDLDALRSAGLVRGRSANPVKLLSTGDVTKALVVRLDKVTAASRKKIEAAGGRVEDSGDGSSSS